MQDGGEERELLRTRILLDAAPEAVGEAVAQALLAGQPGQITEATFEGVPPNVFCLPLPWPLGQEWEGVENVDAGKCWHDALVYLHHVCTFGLRPLRSDEACVPRSDCGCSAGLCESPLDPYIT